MEARLRLEIRNVLYVAGKAGWSRAGGERGCRIYIASSGFDSTSSSWRAEPAAGEAAVILQRATYKWIATF